MELYKVKKAGFASPLSSGEISHLFRVGHLHRRVRCKATGEENWRTIGELFPLLDYGSSAYSLPSEGSRSRPRLALTFAVVVALMATGAFVYGSRPVRRSVGSQPLAQSPHQEVAAATAARIFLLYSTPASDSTGVRTSAKSRSPQAAGALVLARYD